MLKFEPQYFVKPWGGRRLEEHFGRALPEGSIGEAWELGDFGDYSSVVAAGDEQGQSLGDLWRAGKLGGSASGEFPFLLKWLDSGERLSVQVHPDAEFCENTRLGSPKTEAWYIAYAELKSKLHIGNYPGLDGPTLKQSVSRGSIEKWMYEAMPRPGEIYLVEAGTMHSIGAGFLILEIQQPSDTTFRIYDWHSEGESEGEARELHVEQAAACIKYNRFDLPRPARDEVRGPSFHLRKMTMGSAVPAEGLRVVVAEMNPCTLLTDQGDEALKPGDVVVAQPSDGVVRISSGNCLLIGERD